MPDLLDEASFPEDQPEEEPAEASVAVEQTEEEEYQGDQELFSDMDDMVAEHGEAPRIGREDDFQEEEESEPRQRRTMRDNRRGGPRRRLAGRPGAGRPK